MLPSEQTPSGPASPAETLYQKAGKLIEPYLILSDKPAKARGSTRARKDIDLAIGYLEKVVALVPQEFAPWWLLGKAFEVADRPDRSYLAFKQASDLNPSHPDVGREFVRVCIKLGKGKEAV